MGDAKTELHECERWDARRGARPYVFRNQLDCGYLSDCGSERFLGVFLFR